jgi:hypothetical protein
MPKGIEKIDSPIPCIILEIDICEVSRYSGSGNPKSVYSNYKRQHSLLAVHIR